MAYIELDYEAVEPSWALEVCDSIDYGLELHLDDGTVCSIIWHQDSSADIERLGVGREALMGSELCTTARVSVWDASDHWRANDLTEIAAVSTAWTQHPIGRPVSAEEREAGKRAHERREVWQPRPFEVVGWSDLCLITIILTSLKATKQSSPWVKARRTGLPWRGRQRRRLLLPRGGGHLRRAAHQRPDVHRQLASRPPAACCSPGARCTPAAGFAARHDRARVG